MMACHAVVQRLLLESLGVVPPLPGSSVQVPVPSPSGTVGHGALLWLAGRAFCRSTSMRGALARDPAPVGFAAL